MKEYDWLQPTLERLSDLLKMPDVHNSYGTPKVDPGLAWRGLKLILGVNAILLPVPTILPTMAGGLLFTWHGLEKECSLSISTLASNVSVRKGALSRDVGEFEAVEQCLLETLHEISRELRLEPKP